MAINNLLLRDEAVTTLATTHDQKEEGGNQEDFLMKFHTRMVLG